MSDTNSPATIRQYRVITKIGEGGMGQVYLAQDTKLGRKVALKILPDDVISNPERLRRFEGEAQAASALNHPNIITIHEIGSSGNTHFIVTEFIEGETLRRHLRRAQLNIERSLEIATQVASALDVAHKSGIAHRDIKPENIMVRTDGLVKILDFGLAKLTDSPQSDAATPDASTRLLVQTTPGIVMGTVTYMSPEQARGKVVDARTDIFSFGVVLYEMLVGRSPFAGETTSDVIASILTVHPLLPSSFDKKIPIELDQVVDKALKKDRDERYQSAAELLADLRHMQRRRQLEEIEREFGVTRTSLKPEHAKVHSPTAINSLAVLPFSNDGDDPNIEYLTDGLTENILFGLSQLPKIEVIARSAVFRHKGSREDPISIGKDLGVGAIVTGRIRQHDDTLLITAEMIDVETGRQLWGARYKRSNDALFDVEDEIASEVSEKLRLTLSPDKQRVLDRRRTENPDAYHSYLKARFYWGKRTQESLTKSLQLFRQAIEADPMYALAYAGLAEGYVPFAFYGFQAPREAYSKARAAAERATEIDPELPEALTLLGSVLVHLDWKPREGEELLRKAVATGPKYPRAHQSLAECLTVTGRFSEANAEMKKALDLDPLSLHMNAAVVMHLYFGRLYTEAIDQGLQAIELDPSFYPTLYFLGLAYLARGQYSEAITQLEQARTLSGSSTLMIGSLASALAASGKVDDANSLLAELEQIEKTRYVSQTPIAATYALKGDVAEALSRLERACDDRCPWSLYAVVSDARFDGLREEPAFKNLFARIAGS